MRPNRRALAKAAATAVLLLTAACGGANPEPAPLPKSSTPSASPTASATPSAPVMPAAAKAKTKAGAMATVRQFLRALNFSGEAGETQSLRRIYSSSCTRCEAISDGIDATYSAGGSYQGGSWIESSIQFYKIQGDVAILDATVDYTAQTWIRKRGATPTRYRASANHLHAFQLQWSKDQGWRVGSLDPQQ